MKIDIQKTDGQTVITLDGMLDSSSAAQFQETVNGILSEPADFDLLLDCSGLAYISSQGIRTVLTLIKASIARKGKLVFSGIRPAVKEVFDLCGLSQTMTFV